MPDFPNPTPTPEAVAAIDAFKKAEIEYEDYEAQLASGDFIAEIITNSQGDISKARAQFQEFWNRGRTLIEDYNVKLRAAKQALRQLVQLAPTQWRGPDGSATSVSSGPFHAVSVTKRRFNSQSLFSLAQAHGLMESLLNLRTTDKNGKEIPMIKQEWDIQYAPLLRWLQANNLDDVVTGSYDEEEATPQCRGPKELYFFGDKKKE